MIQAKDKERIKKDAVDALLHLRHNKDFQAYQEYLALFQAETRAQGDTMVSPNKEWNQGWCQCLSYILELPAAINPKPQKS